MVVERRLVLELKSVNELHPVHEELLTYMKILNVDFGLLLNFNVAVLKDGIRRRTRKSV